MRIMILTAGLGMGGGDLGRTTQPRIGAQILRSESSLESKSKIMADMRKKEKKHELLEPRPKRQEFRCELTVRL